MDGTTNSCQFLVFIINFAKKLTLLNVFIDLYLKALVIQTNAYLVLTFMWITKKIKPKIKQRHPRTIYAIPKNGFFPPIQDGVVKINCFFPLKSFTGKSKPKMITGILIFWRLLATYYRFLVCLTLSIPILEAFIKPSEVPQRSVKINISVYFYF